MTIELSVKLKIFYQKNLLNGNDCQASFPLNRGLLFGESVFTSLSTINGRIPFLNDHFDRLRYGVEKLYQVNFQKDFSILEDLIEVRKHLGEGDFYFRITFFQTYGKRPKEEVQYFILCQKSVPTLQDQFQNPSQLSVGEGHFQPLGRGDSNLKMGSYGKAFADISKDNDHDDFILFTIDQKVKELTSSNIFLRKGNSILTPSLEEGVLNGIFRKNLIQCLKEQDVKVIEKDISKSDLHDAEEIWATNAVRGPMIIRKWNQKAFLTPDQPSSKFPEVFNSFYQYCEKHCE